MDMDVNLSGVAVKATQSLSDGASEVYARLRASEKDEMSQSETTLVAAYMATMNAPPLPPPDIYAKDSATTEISGETSIKSALLAIGAQVAERWSESVAEASRERREYENSPLQRANEDYRHQLNTADNPKAYSDAHTVAATMIIGTAYTGFLAGNIDVGSQSSISYNVIADSAQQMVALVPGDMRAELGLIGALFANGAAYQATWITVGEAEKTQGRGLNLEFAKNYASRLIKLCNDDQFTSYLTAIIINHLEGTERPSPETIQQWVNIAKIGMLLSALALFYQLETGGQSGAEVVAMLKPDAQALAASDPRSGLIKMIQSYLKTLDPATAEKALENIMGFLDSNKSVKSLTDPVTVLQGALGDDATVGLRSLLSSA